MGLGEAEVGEETVPQILSDVSFVTLDHLSRSGLVGLDYFAEVLGIEPTGEFRRSNEVTKHHGELAPLGLGDRSQTGRAFVAELGAFGIARAAARAIHAPILRSGRLKSPTGDRVLPCLLGP